MYLLEEKHILSLTSWGIVFCMINEGDSRQWLRGKSTICHVPKPWPSIGHPTRIISPIRKLNALSRAQVLNHWILSTWLKRYAGWWTTDRVSNRSTMNLTSEVFVFYWKKVYIHSWRSKYLDKILPLHFNCFLLPTTFQKSVTLRNTFYMDIIIMFIGNLFTYCGMINVWT